jgi:glycosyltransferase involved in cell wall biosynthesis
MPRVTIAIPTHNRAELVVEAVESALGQTYADTELIVIDNGSTDDTAARLEPFLDRIRLVRQENRGRAGARNRAITEASGEYIAFLDSDDTWLPDKLARQVPHLDANPDVALVHGQVEVIDDAGHPLAAETRHHQALWSRAHREPVSYAGYALECRCFTSTVLVRREVLVDLGGYDEQVGLEDLDLYLRIALDHRIAFLDGPPLARYRFHGGQTDNRELTLGHVNVSIKHLRLLEAQPGGPDVRRARRNFLLALAWSHHVLLDRGAARAHALAAIRIDPTLLLDAGLLRRLAVTFLPDQLVARLRRRRAALPQARVDGT